MTPEQERAGAELFAAGKSEREVAAALGVGNGSAHRLAMKLAARGEAAADPGPEMTEPEPSDTPSMLMTAMPEPAGEDEAAGLAALGELRAALVEQLETHSGRADSSLKAVRDLERQRIEVLADGGDAAALRERIRDARADLDDWATATHLLSERLAAVDGRIAEINGRRELDAKRAELDAAVAVRDAVYARSGDRLRAAVAAVRAAAEDFCAVFAEEQAADARVMALAHAVAAGAQALGEAAPMVPAAVSTGISVGAADAYAGPPLALTRALTRAQHGDVAAVAEQLGQVNGWLPPPPPTAEEIEQYRKVAADRARQLAELKAAAQSGPRVPEQPVPVGTDQFGRPVDQFGNVLVPRGSLPHPMDVYREGYANGTGGAHGSGYRTGW